jgi:NAD(P)-dependent dehydrogenase (short-subunit alcohol dehydrogenase family)
MEAILNPMDLRLRTFLVTGASSGLGRQVAILLSQLGARIVLTARNRERLQQTLDGLSGEGHVIELFDLCAVDAIPEWLKTLSARIGPLDGLVHCAGSQLTLPVRSLRRDQLEALMTVNMTAGLFLAKGFRQKGVYEPNGSIVFVSSVRGLVGESAMSAYSASKGALIALTRSLAVEFAQQRIRVNCVAPAFVRTEMVESVQAAMTADEFARIEAMHPLGIGEPRDVAYAIAFLLAQTGRWITGTTLVVDGGYTAH